MKERGWVAGAAAGIHSESPALEAVSLTDQITALLDHYEQSLFAFLVVMLGDPDIAKDCAQDTFIRAYESLKKGKPVGVQWLYKVARNRAMDEFRRRSRERPHGEPIDETTAAELGVSEQTLAVHQALQQLSPDDREVLYLAEVDGFTSIQIGALLGARPGAIRMRLCRAHDRFRKAYGDEP